ncbi:hypothetical protein J5N97_020289 [Dioscorea zingiberensis]|uniref:Uncharacterized protein n=1 Tax=Dioscorea zingiberensis TaxID=325984 RepID=A0A9D5HDI2_9LILI|nr:hypothetical protein J5N97_020289 [Dioscorea zingiberensis]
MAAAAGAPDGTESAAVVPTEDAVQALIDHLVLPLLPRRDSSKEPPPIHQQEAVAKQVQAVVLLYNYYHRKQFPQLEFLDFVPFCKAATIANPSLLIYMKYMHGFEVEAGDIHNKCSILSITEKTIVNACKISAALDAAKDAPLIEGFPVSKIAVFLLNPVKKTCLLQFSSMTKGVWSLLEKDLDMPLDYLGGSKNKKLSLKNNTGSNMILADGSSADDDVLQKYAFSVVQKNTGIDPSTLRILGCHLTYSLSEEKRTTMLYIMEYNQTINGEFAEVPTDDVMSSLRGPLVRLGVTPEVTSVVEYYHLLPYAHIISEWLSREPPPKGSLDLQKQEAHVDKFSVEPEPTVKNHIINNKYSKNTPAMALNSNIIKTEHEAKNKKKNHPSCMNGSQETACKSKNKTSSSSMKLGIPSNLQEQSMACEASLSSKKEMMKRQVINDQGIQESSLSESSAADLRPQKKADGSSLEHVQQPFCQSKEQNIGYIHIDNNTEQLASKANVSLDPDVFKDKADQVDVVKRLNGTRTEDGGLLVQKDNAGGNSVQDRMITNDLPLVTLQYCSKNHDKRNNMLLASLRTLKRKRNELCNRHRVLEDEIAQCEMNIQNILSVGEGNVVSNIDTMLDASAILSSSQMSMDESACFEESLPELTKRKKLSEAILFLRSPCQELDDICIKNNWILPRYTVLPSVSDSKFQSSIIVQGVDFEYTCRGDLEDDPCEARQSAASHMLIKLRAKADKVGLPSQSKKGKSKSLAKSKANVSVLVIAEKSNLPPQIRKGKTKSHVKTNSIVPKEPSLGPI